MKTSILSNKMKTLLHFLIIGVFCLSLSAEEKKYAKLLEYEDVTVREVLKDGVRIMHKAGFTTIPIEKLPEEIRQELGMSLDGVNEHREAVAKKQADAALKARIEDTKKKILANAYMQIDTAKVFQVVDGGILAYVHITWDGTYIEEEEFETKSYRVGNALSGYRTERQRVSKGIVKSKNMDYHKNWLIYIKCDTRGMVDDEVFSGDVWKAGTYQYQTAIGGSKTIPKYTTNPADIVGR